MTARHVGASAAAKPVHAASSEAQKAEEHAATTDAPKEAKGDSAGMPKATQPESTAAQMPATALPTPMPVLSASTETTAALTASTGTATPAQKESSGASVPEMLTAIGTIAAVVVALLSALLSETLWRWWRRPVLRAYVRRDDSGCFYKTPLVVDGNRQTVAYYLRLWIVNEGRGPAEEAQVFATSLTRRDESGDFHPVKQFLPMGLLWTHSQPASTTLRRLHRGIGHHCELGCVLKLAPQLFALLVEVNQFTGWNRLQAGVYRLTLQLACGNGKPSTQLVEFQHDGQWRDDEAAMFRDGLRCMMVDGAKAS